LPVVSDFDMFTLGMKGQKYERLDKDQQGIALHMLDSTELIFKSPASVTQWNSRWLQVLQTWEESGFRPNMPKFGFGDPTSTGLVTEIVDHTRSCGAVRHGPECFNIFFPQELDPEYLVVWEGFDAACRWQYVDEPGLRNFLSQRLADGFTFPLNPVWPCRDLGWYDLYKRMRAQDGDAFDAWFPPDSGLRERIEDIHKSYPAGFTVLSSQPADNLFKLTDKDRAQSTQEDDRDFPMFGNGDNLAQFSRCSIQVNGGVSTGTSPLSSSPRSPGSRPSPAQSNRDDEGEPIQRHRSSVTAVTRTYSSLKLLKKRQER